MTGRSLGSGALPPGVPPTFPRVTIGRRNGTSEALSRARRVGLHPGQEVLVGLDRVSDVGVPEPLAHDLHGHSLLDEQAPVGVAQVMLVPTSA